MNEADLMNKTGTEDRQAFVDNLGEYISSAKHSIDSFIDKFGWTKEYLCKDLSSPKVRCPFNPGHVMPAASLEKHKEICAWKNEGYSKEEIEKALPSSHFFYQNSTSVVPVLIDKAMQSKILTDAATNSGDQSFAPVDRNVPRTMDRVITEFTPRERLAIYEFVIDRMKQIKKESLVKFEDLQYTIEAKRDTGEGKPKSELEMIAEHRDYKRRRQSYRAKNVHITKKSYTEVMREVIQNQMEVLSENVDETSREETKELVIKSEESDNNKSRSHRQDRNERSRSSKRSHDDERTRKSSHQRKHKREKREEEHHKHHRKHHKHKKSKSK